MERMAAPVLGQDCESGWTQGHGDSKHPSSANIAVMHIAKTSHQSKKNTSRVTVL